MSLAGVTVVFLSAFLCVPASSSAKISVSKFRDLTEDHIQRITVLGAALYERFPEYFGELSRESVVTYLSKYHDAPKLWSLRQLRRHQYKFFEGIDQRLSRYYGLNRYLAPLSEAQQKELDETIEELNRIEAQHKEEFATRYALSESQMEALLLLERAVDLADTGLTRWKEMGLSSGKAALASTYLKQSQVSEELWTLVLWMEDHFETILNPF